MATRKLKATARLQEHAAGNTIQVMVSFPTKVLFKGQPKDLVEKIIADKQFQKNLAEDLVHCWKAYQEENDVDPSENLEGLVPPKYKLKSTF